jgi:hypothetical protein
MTFRNKRAPGVLFVQALGDRNELHTTPIQCVHLKLWTDISFRAQLSKTAGVCDLLCEPVYLAFALATNQRIGTIARLAFVVPPLSPVQLLALFHRGS